MDKVRILLEEELIKDKNIPEFNVGDTVRVVTKIFEQDKVRLSPFEGIVIAKKGSGIRSSFTVRRVSFGEGIERVFPLYSPHIEKIEVLQPAKKTKRAKLYYLRKRIGKSASQV